MGVCGSPGASSLTHGTEPYRVAFAYARDGPHGWREGGCRSQLQHSSGKLREQTWGNEQYYWSRVLSGNIDIQQCSPYSWSCLFPTWTAWLWPQRSPISLKIL